jgi:UDP-GlcNAc:undecaprenyl-phosphate GlcNAc-1-phosphate transferase
MDGLSAGIAAISSFALFIFSIPNGNSYVALLSIVLAGACIGFLFYNFNPARIFMGDCGSMFLGFILAVLSISGTWKHASTLFVTFLVPVIILGIPIIDTAFVTLMRKIRSQPISQGGRDHLSHRLVALGFSEKKTVLILYAISASAGLGALFFNEISPFAFSFAALLFVMGLFYFCFYLGYSERKNNFARDLSNGTGYQVNALLVNAQRFFEIFVDLVLIVVSYFTAYLIRFEGGLPDLQKYYFIQTLPIVVVLKISVFYFFGLYQTVWRHVGVRDFINILKSVLISSLIIICAILMYARFQFFSRTVFAVDASSYKRGSFFTEDTERVP